MIEAQLHRIVYQDPITPDAMRFSLVMPESEYKAAQTVEQRVALALRVLAAMEKGMTQYQTLVNDLRVDCKMERHDFGYPPKAVACQS